LQLSWPHEKASNGKRITGRILLINFIVSILIVDG